MSCHFCLLFISILLSHVVFNLLQASVSDGKNGRCLTHVRIGGLFLRYLSMYFTFVHVNSLFYFKFQLCFVLPVLWGDSSSFIVIRFLVFLSEYFAWIGPRMFLLMLRGQNFTNSKFIKFFIADLPFDKWVLHFLFYTDSGRPYCVLWASDHK